MEPFGLFQFLQSLLQNPPAQEGQDEVKAVDLPTEKTMEPPPIPNNDAYLKFIENHEKRSQGIKKK